MTDLLVLTQKMYKKRIEQVFESTDMCIDVYCKKRTSSWAVNMLCCK